jgi:hypothetical protein
MEECRPTAHDFELAHAVGKKRARSEEEGTHKSEKAVKKNRQDDVLKAIGDKPVTERHILEQVGDNRYTREILRRLMALEVVQRVGRGGSNDPYLYKFVRTPEEALGLGMVDPAVDIRMQRIENKILSLLMEQEGFVTEKQIRAIVGDNTGTGKALRRLVNNSRVLRIGRGGADNPFTYKINADAIDTRMMACAAIDSSIRRQVSVVEYDALGHIITPTAPDSKKGMPRKEGTCTSVGCNGKLLTKSGTMCFNCNFSNLLCQVRALCTAAEPLRCCGEYDALGHITPTVPDSKKGMPRKEGTCTSVGCNGKLLTKSGTMCFNCYNIWGRQRIPCLPEQRELNAPASPPPHERPAFCRLN